jgi:hypothetical protein
MPLYRYKHVARCVHFAWSEDIASEEHVIARLSSECDWLLLTCRHVCIGCNVVSIESIINLLGVRYSGVAQALVRERVGDFSQVQV